ncbi:MAG: hypothetical protein JXR95_09285 [Deltaproteobacteria bacterium]|nr:hypothetical protein [Deltaproteobacteria bacterium]
MSDLVKITPPKPGEDIPCGLYKTTKKIGENIPENALVYYHNHGDPGPGCYPPEKWNNNKAVFSKKGYVLPDIKDAKSLIPLPSEGFYRVAKNFYCCDNKCRLFERDTLIQLGYNGMGEPIAFIPVWTEKGIELPKQGSLIDDERLNYIKPLKLQFNFKDTEHPENGEK